MKTYFYALLDIGWTCLYFVYWGGSYGLLLGLITGMAVLPLLGPVMGTFIGIGLGMGGGGLLGVSIGLLHTLFFDHDTDLERYRNRLAIGAGVSVTAIALLGAVLCVHIFASLYAYWRPIEQLLSGGVIGITLSWTALSSAYTASYYPDQIIKRLIRQHRTTVDRSTIVLKNHAAIEQVEAFLTHIYPRWMYGVTGLLGAAVALGAMIFTKPVILGVAPDVLMAVLIGAFLGVFGTFGFALYCAMGNGLLLAFLKRLVFKERGAGLSAHHRRVILTLISFVFTVITTWWTVVFAPLCALYIAYHVYHTVALPNEMQEKSKRKEAAQTPSKVPAALMLPEKADGEIVNHDLSRLADPSTAQQAQHI